MGACFDRLRCEVFQNLFLSPMNTGFLGSAVATVLTVYGIETYDILTISFFITLLQQYLPFTVLKLDIQGFWSSLESSVATVLTVYGIETYESFLIGSFLQVATVLTVYGIETIKIVKFSYFNFQLQQYLPFTVLKRL